MDVGDIPGGFQQRYRHELSSEAGVPVSRVRILAMKPGSLVVYSETTFEVAEVDHVEEYVVRLLDNTTSIFSRKFTELYGESQAIDANVQYYSPPPPSDSESKEAKSGSTTSASAILTIAMCGMCIFIGVSTILSVVRRKQQVAEECIVRGSSPEVDESPEPQFDMPWMDNPEKTRQSDKAVLNPLFNRQNSSSMHGIAVPL